MLGATQAVLLGAAGCPFVGYAATVTAIPGLLAYWRFGEPSGTQLVDETGGARHGTYTPPVTLGAVALAQNSDDAVSFSATGFGTVSHDAALALSALTVSLWFRLPTMPAAQQAILFSKDGSGLVNGDFVIAVEEDGELYAHFQDTSTSHRVSSAIAITANTIHHVVVTADNSGFELWHNGRHMGSNASFTGAWSSNTRSIQFAKVAWQAALTDAIIDEVALWDRALSDEEIIELSQRTGTPIAVNDGTTVEANRTVEIDVASNDQWVGRQEDLAIEVVSQGSNGTATVVGTQIEYTADDLSSPDSDSFTYKFTDANGASSIGTVNADITVPTGGGGGDDGFGGTLVFEWQPDASWIDGVPLADRHYDANPGGVADVNRWTGGASVGAGLIKAINPNLSLGNADACWNRAPAAPTGVNAGIGVPSLETWVKKNTNGGGICFGFFIHLYNQFQGTPRHCRVVVDIKSSKTSDPTTYKSQGIGTLSGGYTDFKKTYNNGTGTTTGKYPCGMHIGSWTGSHGGCRANWWQGAPCASEPLPGYCGPTAFTFNSNRGSLRTAFGSDGKTANYTYCYGRPGRCGLTTKGSAAFANSGFSGVWHRVEQEVRLTSEASVPSNAVYNDPPITPSQTGDGFSKQYLTLDIDGELGTSGTRFLNVQDTGLLWFCREDNVASGRDNLHKETAPGANINGIYLEWIYGGGTGSLEEAWLWIRRLQFYVYP